jgi:hypothetical protein
MPSAQQDNNAAAVIPNTYNNIFDFSKKNQNIFN